MQQLGAKPEDTFREDGTPKLAAEHFPGAVQIVVHGALHRRLVVRVEVRLGLSFEGLLTTGRTEVIRPALVFGGVPGGGLVVTLRGRGSGLEGSAGQVGGLRTHRGGGQGL